MTNIRTIAGRQFRSYFNGPIAYIVVAVFLLVLGFLFWQTFFLQQRATAREMFNYFSLNFFTAYCQAVYIQVDIFSIIDDFFFIECNQVFLIPFLIHFFHLKKFPQMFLLNFHHVLNLKVFVQNL